MSSRAAVVLMAYGTPASADEIEAYYTDIRRGRPPTPEQLADLVRRYAAIGGLSPLLARTAAQRDALQRGLVGRGVEATVHLGFKHCAPSIEDAVRAAEAAGATELVGLVLAPHDSSVSVGAYIARMTAAARVPVREVRSWATLPAYVDFVAAAVDQRLASMPAGTRLVVTAHSLPRRVLDSGDPCVDQLTATARAVAGRLGLGDDRWQIAWQSAGRTAEPWLEPGLLETIDALAAEGVPAVLVAAAGFVADHLEVLYDLDIEASARAATAGIGFDRVPCVNDDGAVMDGLAGLVAAALDQP